MQSALMPERRLCLMLQMLQNGKVGLTTRLFNTFLLNVRENAPRSKIFWIPLRWVRVNKGKELGKVNNIIARSRLVIPGHADPQLGEFRTDSPTTTPAAVKILKTLAITKNWLMCLFDVSTAFLSGNPTDREVYVRAPADGLPAAASTPAIAPQDPQECLWVGRGTKVMVLESIAAIRAIRNAGTAVCPFDPFEGKTVAVCTLRVDDGLIAGPRDSDVFQRLLRDINQEFNIKEWQCLGPEPLDFLGCQVSLKNGCIVDSMNEYVKRIDAMKAEKGNAPLSDSQRTAFRRLIMQLRWPAQHVLPECLFQVSSLAQKVTTATQADVREANKLLEDYKVMAQKGLMELRYFPLTGAPFIISFFDAGLGKSSETRAQLGIFCRRQKLEAVRHPPMSSFTRAARLRGWSNQVWQQKEKP